MDEAFIARKTLWQTWQVVFCFTCLFVCFKTQKMGGKLTPSSRSLSRGSYEENYLGAEVSSKGDISDSKIIKRVGEASCLPRCYFLFL